MLATAWPMPFAEPGWLFEPKWDGIRGILTWDGHTVALHTRTDAEVSARYPELILPRSTASCVLDGEVVVLADGRASFERLQQRSSLTPAGVRDHPVSFVAFDLLHLGSVSLVDVPIEERRDRLEHLGLGAPFVTVAPIDDGAALWDVVVARDLEGMVAKRVGSPYRPGVRSADWRKVANLHTVKAAVRRASGRWRSVCGTVSGCAGSAMSAPASATGTSRRFAMPSTRCDGWAARFTPTMSCHRSHRSNRCWWRRSPTATGPPREGSAIPASRASRTMPPRARPGSPKGRDRRALSLQPSAFCLQPSGRRTG